MEGSGLQEIILVLNGMVFRRWGANGRYIMSTRISIMNVESNQEDIVCLHKLIKPAENGLLGFPNGCIPSRVGLINFW